MAGLQYNFFPTDFFYPRPQSTNDTTTQKPVLAIQKKRGSVNELERLKTFVQNDNIDNSFHGGYKIVKVPSPLLGQNQQASLNSFSWLLLFPENPSGSA